MGTIDSLPQPSDTYRINVDYETDPAILLLEFMKYCVESVPNLAILSLVEDLSQRSNSSLPSWIPDFHRIANKGSNPKLGLNRDLCQAVPYNAAFKSPDVPVDRLAQEGILRLKGCCIGTINSCSLDGTRDAMECAAPFLTSLLDVCLGLPLLLRDRRDRIDGLCGTLVADSEGSSRPAPAELGSCFHDWILYYLLCIRSYSEDWPETLSDICNKLTELCASYEGEAPLPNVALGQLWRTRLQERRDGKTCDLRDYTTPSLYIRFNNALVFYENVMFGTSAGDLGSGPLSSQPGDQVWVLENTRMPFILRPTQGSAFQLLGECYVHGIMDGQLLEAGELEFIPIKIV